ncbi:MAG: methyl-accepting chemotaxis protein [Nitrospirae bacterium]|nr:MAG: methyl-accepting chemotaxis protein [Nitrospirota bacterium]
MNTRWRRRNYFIKRDLQGRYIFSFFLFVTLGSILFALIFSTLTSGTLTMTYENYKLQIGKTPVILLREFISAHWIFLITGGVLVTVLSMFLTHRFAGPVFRFEKTLQSIIDGKLDFAVRLRKKDEAKEIAELFNRLIETLNRDISSLKNEVAILEKLLDEMVQQDTTITENEWFRKIRSSVEDIKTVLKRYST